MLSTHSQKTCTVLVVDDEPALRSFADCLLTELGYAAMLADSGRSAVQLLLQDPEAVDAVLLDMTMPGLRPEETFRLLNEIRPGLPVIVLSGEPETVVRACFAYGTIAGYVEKPYTEVELEAALTQALAAANQPLRPFQLVTLSDKEKEDAKYEYMASRRLEIPKIEAWLAALDFKALRIVGHSLKGSGGCFGLSAITHIGAKLESFAEASDATGCGQQIAALKDCLDCEERRP